MYRYVYVRFHRSTFCRHHSFSLVLVSGCVYYHMCYINTFHCNSSSQAVPRMILREVTVSFRPRNLSYCDAPCCSACVCGACFDVIPTPHAACVRYNTVILPNGIPLRDPVLTSPPAFRVFAETEVARPAVGVETDRPHREGTGITRVCGLDRSTIHALQVSHRVFSVVGDDSLTEKLSFVKQITGQAGHGRNVTIAGAGN